MKDKVRKRFFVICFFVMLLLGAGGEFLVQGSNLQGETLNEDSDLEISDIWNGKWQVEYENQLTSNLKIREWLIPIRNQIMYSVFGKSPNSNIIIGKNQNLYEEEYICFETQIYEPMSGEEIDVLVNKLKTLDTNLKNKGKHLFVFITPSKAEIYFEDIPDKYMNISPENRTESTYSLFVKALEQTDIAWYDSTEDVRRLKETAEFPVFPKTGTHWSNVTGMICAEYLADSMEEQLGINLPEIEVSYEVCDEPVAPDTDIYNLLNLIQKPKETFYKPIVKSVDSEKENYNIFARGGSFMGQSLGDLIEHGYFAESYYLENTFAICPEGTYSGSFDSYDKLPVRDMIDNSDIIFLEVNEEAVNRMSFGFIDYLLDNNLLN